MRSSYFYVHGNTGSLSHHDQSFSMEESIIVVLLQLCCMKIEVELKVGISRKRRGEFYHRRSSDIHTHQGVAWQPNFRPNADKRWERCAITCHQLLKGDLALTQPQSLGMVADISCLA